jgi:hypothetical protein
MARQCSICLLRIWARPNSSRHALCRGGDSSTARLSDGGHYCGKLLSITCVAKASYGVGAQNLNLVDCSPNRCIDGRSFDLSAEAFAVLGDSCWCDSHRLNEPLQARLIMKLLPSVREFTLKACKQPQSSKLICTFLTRSSAYYYKLVTVLALLMRLFLRMHSASRNKKLPSFPRWEIWINEDSKNTIDLLWLSVFSI